MHPSLKSIPAVSRLALCIAWASLLSACGGGGGGMVRSAPPPPPVAPPPPPTANVEPCAEPVTGDCTVFASYTLTFDENGMIGGRQSDFALIVTTSPWDYGGGGWLTLYGDYRFSGGTSISGEATLIVDGSLTSNTTVLADGGLWLRGTVRGDVSNAGVLTAGQTKMDASHWQTSPNRARIEGDYTQHRTGTFIVTLGWPLQVTGQVLIEGGTLDLRGPRTGGGAYVLPAAPSSQALLHADGGVTGTFDTWVSREIFIDGSVRYTDNDVFFDLSRASLTSAMGLAAADGLTLASAANVEAAFVQSDRFATTPDSLDANRRAFLQSAAAIQHIDSYAQATSTLDSLSGASHASTQRRLLDQTTFLPQVAVRLDRLRPGIAGYWSHAVAGGGAGATGRYDEASDITGYDRWLGTRWLAGGSVRNAELQASFEREGGNSRGFSQMADVYLHYRGDRNAYSTVSLAAGRTHLAVNRTLDLASAGRHDAHSERRVQLSRLLVEAGRHFTVGAGQLTPFAAMELATLRSPAFTEMGNTGFELQVLPSAMRRGVADVGLRYARTWRAGNGAWWRMALDARHREELAGGGDVLRAAFIATPEVVFDIHGNAFPASGERMWVDLAGGHGERWSWNASYDTGFGNLDDRAWRLGMRWAF